MPETTIGVLAWLSLASALAIVQAAAVPVSSADFKTRATSGKRGLCYTSASLANEYNGNSQVKWGYNWGYPAGGLDTSFEYSPMLWGDPTNNVQYQQNWKNNVTAAIKSGSKHLLAFNEPDINNLSPAAAAASYMKFMQPYSSSTVKLGAPAVTNGGPPTGLTWLSEFLGNCTSCTIDFVPIHFYAYYNAIEYFTSYIQQASQIAGSRPLWITEFQGQNAQYNAPATDAQQAQFMKTVLPWLDSLSYVERYSYFGVFESSSSGGTYLMNSAGNGMSKSGTAYAHVSNVNSTTPTALVSS